jgi:hypothetical protein
MCYFWLTKKDKTMTDFNHSDPLNERRINQSGGQETVFQNSPPVNSGQPNYQQQAPPPTYQQAYQQNFQPTPKTYPAVKMGEWMLALFLVSIPVVGFILLIVWALGSEANPSKANWAKAMLLWGIIYSAVLVVVYAVIIMMVGFSVENMNLNF